MAIHVGPFFSKWVWLCLMMASMASAIPLSKFQPITATTISLGCILAYNAEIPGCSINDFVAGSTCSASCVRGLKRVESNLEYVCDRTEVSEISVLGQALLGNLVELLCPGTSSPENPVATPSRSPTAAPTTLTTQRVSRTSPLTFTPVQPPSTTTTAVTETEEPETSTSTSSVSPTEPPSPPPIQTVIPSSRPTSSSSSSTSAPEPSEDTGGRGTGGGSPFDPVIGNGSEKVTVCLVQAIAVGLGMSLLFLW
ncbi:uncharacterized protein B0H64DRAFT_154493 [Chaetomium fimeti]|uniref:Extracellular membrane protein CFEM domain-containing protein n=1 Tax=Chaetomium fimeti TaxID=1854472 RepID=A0AAE0HFX8_9PEZI|nr:hypothetical protein B0H64DRAFT_154493 [Chaetomium fimeti]